MCIRDRTLRLLLHPAITVRQQVEIRAIERPRATPLSPLEAIAAGERISASRKILPIVLTIMIDRLQTIVQKKTRCVIDGYTVIWTMHCLRAC